MWRVEWEHGTGWSGCGFAVLASWGWQPMQGGHSSDADALAWWLAFTGGQKQNEYMRRALLGGLRGVKRLWFRMGTRTCGSVQPLNTKGLLPSESTLCSNSNGQK